MYVTTMSGSGPIADRQFASVFTLTCIQRTDIKPSQSTVFSGTYRSEIDMRLYVTTFLRISQGVPVHGGGYW
jgi:hypothetical protein